MERTREGGGVEWRERESERASERERELGKIDRKRERSGK